MRGLGRRDCGGTPTAIPVRLRAGAIRLLALSALLPTLLHAALTPDEAKRLDADLTPVGAERAGNADGSIPPWTGGLASPQAHLGIGLRLRVARELECVDRGRRNMAGAPIGDHALTSNHFQPMPSLPVRTWQCPMAAALWSLALQR